MTSEKLTPRREIKLTNVGFRIRAANLAAATQALRADAQEGYDSTVRRNEKLAAVNKPPLPLPDTHVESVEATFQSLGFTIARDRAGGMRLTGFEGTADSQGLIINALRAVAAHVETHSYLRWEASNGSVWEDRFTRKKLRVREINPPFGMM